MTAQCPDCGIPRDAGFFDESAIVEAPAVGEEKVVVRYRMHPSYCGVLLYFAQFTDEYANDPSKVETPGLRWQIRCNGQPRDPYVTFDRIINPWGLSGFPIFLRLEQGCSVEFAVRGVEGGLAATSVGKVGCRLLGRYWFNTHQRSQPASCASVAPTAAVTGWS